VARTVLITTLTRIVVVIDNEGTDTVARTGVAYLQRVERSMAAASHVARLET
jgi:hypothetical protein